MPALAEPTDGATASDSIIDTHVRACADFRRYSLTLFSMHEDSEIIKIAKSIGECPFEDWIHNQSIDSQEQKLELSMPRTLAISTLLNGRCTIASAMYSQHLAVEHMKKDDLIIELIKCALNPHTATFFGEDCGYRIIEMFGPRTVESAKIYQVAIISSKPGFVAAIVFDGATPICYSKITV